MRKTRSALVTAAYADLAQGGGIETRSLFNLLSFPNRGRVQQEFGRNL
jgi:hypothetical protein